MRRCQAVIVGCAIALMASLLLARAHPFGNAGLYMARPAQAIMERSSVPADVRAILSAKCADCHSMHTRLPVYDRIAGRFAPLSWLMERDIVEGRKHMNLSLWDTYSADQRQTLAAKIVEETRAHEMPLPQYRMIHRSARISDADILALTRWTRRMPALETGAAAQTAGEGDSVRGKVVFEKRCTGCHAMEQNREGPRLRGVFGRTSGMVDGYPYSPALRKARIVWDDSSLEQWLADPDTLVPGNNMEFHVSRPQERRDLIKFLKEESGK
jgi:cytochrome c